MKKQLAASEERRLENVRLAEENKRLREAEKQRLSEVENLRLNGEELRLKLKEAVDAHDETAKAAEARELEHERLVSSLVSEAERVNEIILGKNVSCLFFRLICSVSCPDPASFNLQASTPRRMSVSNKPWPLLMRSRNPLAPPPRHCGLPPSAFSSSPKTSSSLGTQPAASWKTCGLTLLSRLL